MQRGGSDYPDWLQTEQRLRARLERLINADSADDIALVVNAVLVLAALAYFNATLTLPGIAGLILTVGMAVDANVLIYERIREGMRGGKQRYFADVERLMPLAMGVMMLLLALFTAGLYLDIARPL